jgi:hypothetical protein
MADMRYPRQKTWRECIEAAKEGYRRGKWGEGLFDLPPADCSEFIPLPA